MNREFPRNIPIRLIRKELFQCATITLGAMTLGWGVNLVRSRPLSLNYSAPEARIAAFTEQMSGIGVGASEHLAPRQTLELQDFQRRIDAKDCFIIDARPEIFYRLGHVPGAISLPRESLEEAFVKMRTLLEADKRKAIIIYCSGHQCPDAGIVHDALQKLGFMNVAVFSGGWEEWTSAGLAEAIGQL